MALVLCHQCYSWVEPLADQCPQCDFPIDLRIADPTLDELAAAIGPLVSTIGPVRLTRSALPDRGMLYATANGLFFVPQSTESIRLAPADGSDRTSWSIARSLVRVPLAVLRDGVRNVHWEGRRSTTRVEVVVSPEPLLSAHEGSRLPDVLMRNPGTFFLARRSIRSIRRTFSGWALYLQSDLALRLKSAGDRAGFHAQMSEFAADVREAVCP